MLSPTQRLMAKAMCQGQTVSARELIDTLYSARSDGGPEDANREVRKQIHKLRQKLQPVGVEIETVGVTKSCQGWRMAPDAIARLETVLGT